MRQCGRFGAENIGEDYNMSLSFQKRIRERLTTGFKNWNHGYQAWLKWCDVLYEPDAHYNVNGKRLTLQQYKDAMGQLFSVFDVQLGEFFNILIEDDWCAIRYATHVTNKDTGDQTHAMTMEFVHFVDNPEPVGARVVEGWAISDQPLVLPQRVTV